MARPSTGGIRIRDLANGDRSFAARVRFDGRREYVHLGYASEGMTEDRAQDELAAIRAAIARGDWQPPVFEPDAEPEAPTDPLFGDHAEEWFAGWQHGKAERSRTIVRGHLDQHLLPYFGGLRLSQIDARRVDRYIVHERERGRLGGASLNRVLFDLRRILGVARRYGYLTENPAEGARVAEDSPRRTYLDRPDQFADLLAAADRLDARAHYGQHRDRRAWVVLLVFTGLRIGEALDLRWQDVDLANGRLRVEDSKTPEGRRYVNLLPVVASEMRAMKAKRKPRPTARVFPNMAGKRDARGKVAARVLTGPVREANRGREVPIPHLTPHSCRRTFATVLFMLGEDPLYIAAQMGHTDPTTTVRFYARVMAGLSLAERDRIRGELRNLAGGETSPIPVGQSAGAPV